MDKGLGSLTWWGFSPAIDLIEYHSLASLDDDKEEIKVLLVGSGDIRHILKTVAQRKRHVDELQKQNNESGSQSSCESKALHIYVLENNLELYARVMMLMSIALESTEKFGLQEKVELFAETFGNSLLRSQTATHVQSMANEFVKMVTDFDYLAEKLPLFDLESLKYKERDMLEGIFKLWRKPETTLFDVEKCWDLRVRQHLGTRYDSSKGAFDWDYSMKLCERGAEIINSRNYQRWRKRGVAFELREGTYDVPNKTLASGMVFNVDGDRVARRGYWGDIVVSPYISFGIECNDENYFKKANREYVYTSENVTEFNLTSMLNELQTGERYVPPPINAESDSSSSKTEMTVISEEAEDEEGAAQEADGDKTSQECDYIKCDGVKITFLPLNSLPDMTQKSKFGKLFDLVYFSNSMVHHLVPPIADMFSDDCMVMLETAKFITELSREQYIEFANKIDKMAKAVGCDTMIDVNPEKDSFAFYKFKRG